MRGATRGDGVRGEDVTPNVRTIRAIPLRAARRPAGRDRGARRGVSCRARRSSGSTSEREEAGEPLFANPRNAAAGTMRNLDPALVARRGLARLRRIRSSAPTGRRRRRHARGHAASAARRGDCRSSRTGSACDGIDARDRVLPRVGDEAPATLDVRHRRRRRSRSTTSRCASGSGTTAKFPRWATAFKFPRAAGDDDAAAASRSTSAAPAPSRRSPCSSRCSSPARRSRWRRCTTPRTSRARTSARATGPHREGRRRHPEGRRRRCSSLRPADSRAVGDADDVSGRAAARCSATRRRWSGAARTRRARRGCAAASSTSRRAAR